MVPIELRPEGARREDASSATVISQRDDLKPVVGVLGWHLFVNGLHPLKSPPTNQSLVFSRFKGLSSLDDDDCCRTIDKWLVPITTEKH